MLEINGLSISYGAVEVAHGITLRVDEGRIVALIGPNGAGKSSVLRAVSGLIRPSGGEISFLGAGLIGIPPHEIAKCGVAHVMEGRHLFGGLTVEDNLLLASSNDQTAVAGSIESVYQRWPRLRERKNQFAGTLSGGEQQMTAIGRAMMTRPRLLMLDEPSWGLAPLVVQDLMKAFTRMRDEGMTILLVEQMANLALKISDYAYVMSSGRIVLEGNSQELQSNPDLQATYLGGQVGKKSVMARVPTTLPARQSKEPPRGNGTEARKNSTRKGTQPKQGGLKTVTPPIGPVFRVPQKSQALARADESFAEREKLRQSRQRSFRPHEPNFTAREWVRDASKESYTLMEVERSGPSSEVAPTGRQSSTSRDWRSFEEERKERQQAHLSGSGIEPSTVVSDSEFTENEASRKSSEKP